MPGEAPLERMVGNPEELGRFIDSARPRERCFAQEPLGPTKIEVFEEQR
jgi:hypothetical protein